MVVTLRENQQKLNHCFSKTIYAQTSVDLFKCHSRNASLPCFQPDLAKGEVADWISGYKKTIFYENDLHRHIHKTIGKELNQCEKKRTLRIISTYFMLCLVGVSLWGAISSLKINPQTFDEAFLNIKKFLKIDPLSLLTKRKHNFFYDQILKIPQRYHPEDIEFNTQHFLSQELYKTRLGYVYFIENILKGFFLLLPNAKISPELKTKVTTAASLLDRDIKSSLESIIQLFEQDLMSESDLRKQILELRRAFVPHQIFPFIFIALSQQTPYLFLYSETIETEFQFDKQDFEKLGLNSTFYEMYVHFPLKAHVVKGDQYPFKERAGYFEGEYAIVFSKFALKIEWTAFHEIGHLVDEIRFQLNRIDYPKNIELNSMLFPAVFAKDAKDYLLNRVIPIVRTAKKQDNYVQSSKAILNGIALLVSEQGGGKYPLLTDHFELDHIAAMERLIQNFNNSQIRNLAIKLYQFPEKYLKTAKPGQYKGIIGNAEEFQFGTHLPPQQEIGRAHV